MHDYKLSISGAGKLIGKSDNRTIKKWLQDHKISIHSDGREYVYRLEVELEVLRPICQDFKDKYPYDWEKKLEVICGENKELCQILVNEFSSSFYSRDIVDFEIIDPDHRIFKNLYSDAQTA